MIEFVSYERACALARNEAVVFAEVLAPDATTCSLEIHVEVPGRDGLHETERDDTGPVPLERVHAMVAEVAERHGARYATLCAERADWPPAA